MSSHISNPVVYGKVEEGGVNLNGCTRKEILKSLKLSRECFFPEDYDYMIINVIEGEINYNNNKA